jgi:O-antigen/teichoic acid export membrane protein
LASLLLGSRSHGQLISWILLRVLFETAAVVPMVRLRIREQSVAYGALSAGRLFVSVAFITIALVALDGGLTGVVIAMVAESALFALLATITAARDLTPRFSLPTFRRMLAFGIPLVPFAFGMTILSMGDRYFLRVFGGLDAVGRYAVACKIAAPVTLICRAFQVAWPSVMFSMGAVADARTFYSKVLTYLLLLLGFVGVVVSIFAHEFITLLATSEFVAAYRVVPIVVLAYMALGAFYATVVGSHLTGKTYYLTLAVLIAVLTMCAASVALVPLMGVAGAASATAVGYVTLASSQGIFARRLYPIGYEWRRIALLFLFASALILAGILVHSGSRVVDVAIKLSLIGAYPVLVYVSGFLSPSERAALQRGMRWAFARRPRRKVVEDRGRRMASDDAA